MFIEGTATFKTKIIRMWLNAFLFLTKEYGDKYMNKKTKMPFFIAKD
jgi:hypothetical protein